MLINQSKDIPAHRLLTPYIFYTHVPENTCALVDSGSAFRVFTGFI